MDASKCFKQLLENVESSKLNYVITKTPFSANISVKRSFVKYHVESTEEPINVKVEEKVEVHSKRVTKLKENQKLLELLQQQSDKVEFLEAKLRESRDKLKEVEKEKKGAAKKNEKLDQEVDELCQRVEALEKEVKEKVYTIKVKDNACMKIKKQKEELENRFNKALQEPKTELMKKFKCESCDFCAESTVRLSHHIKRNHNKDQTCQTSNLGN